MKILVWLGICISFGKGVVDNEDVCSLQSCSDPYPPNGSFVDNCNSHPMLRLQGHCCENFSSGHVVGIDLSFCKLRNIKTLFHQYTEVTKINLTNNPDLKFQNTSFLGLKKLCQISVDKNVECNSQWNWFNSSWQAWNNTEDDKHDRKCINQTNTCNLLKQYHNYTCPDNSNCINNGPGQFLCDCKHGWGGYKCLRKTDSDLKLPILAGTAAATVLLSSILWYTQRRHVI
ncbi:all-trans retinoic acid-induced differentiation factor-like [Styela clava]|uniref:all-trans retinoic acid-induced differentiation factor-like n=1 Tax=Styela clava TaxID=7725 RepID=UPI00193967B3|nr:all-trans retinoic acid-induced differentiation factor-like [Styela clava]